MPVLQNAFSNSGWTVAANIGSADAGDAYGGAAAWAPRSRRVQLAGGAAWLARVGASDGITWGARIMAPVPVLGGRDGAVGVAAFAGAGGASAGDTLDLRVPVGATVGYRRALSAHRAIAIYASPIVTWSRVTGGDVERATSTVFRYAIGLDVALTPVIGITLGVESGSDPGAGRPGPRGNVYGIGLSYALSRVP
ncbi:MAG TPA: hypothetical protein VFK13_11510 [Gemmatimonadaceae bacterium]|nr:hypothetical protein [Gemmatimonadaceae bacterium]